MAGMDAFGVKLKRGDGAEPQIFTEIADITSLGGPGMSREVIDVTSHGSVDGWMEKLGGLKDGGELSVDINYQPPVHDFLVADFEDDAPRDYQIVFPDEESTTWSLSLILTGFEPEWPHDDKATASLTFAVNGKPTLS